MRRRLITIVVVLVVAGGFFKLLTGRKGPEIEVLRPQRGPILESFREPGMTRLENTWRVTAQVPGRLNRIALEPGDAVKKDQPLAEYDLAPFDKQIDEARGRINQLAATIKLMEDSRVERTTLNEAKESAKSSAQAVEAARSRVQSAEDRSANAQRDAKRMEELAGQKIISAAELDRARLLFNIATRDLEGARADLAAAEATQRATQMSPQRIEQQIDRKGLQKKELQAQLEQAKAALELAEHERGLAKVVSPIDGVVLQRFERGEKPVMAGADLLLLGSPKDIETVVDVLSQDALKLAPGGEVYLDSELGGVRLRGKVKRVEPQGFTKLSSLGVEQQRVNVIVTIDNPPPVLGVGYRLNARFLTGSRRDALLVPRFAALQAPDNSFYVFRLVNDKIQRAPVKLGLRSELELEVAEGLSEKDWIVAAPDATLEVGSTVNPVESGWNPSAAQEPTSETTAGGPTPG